MRNFRSNEDAIIRRLDLKRSRSCDSLAVKMKIQTQVRSLSDIEREREPVSGTLTALLCIHGVPHLFNDTKYGCKSCHRVGRMR